MSRQTPRRSERRTRSRICARCSKRWPRLEPWPAVTSIRGVTAQPLVRSSMCVEARGEGGQPALLAGAHVGSGMEDQVLDTQGGAAFDLDHEGLAAPRQGSGIGARQVHEIGAVGDDPPQAALREGVPEGMGLVRAQGLRLPLHLVAREDLDGLRPDRLPPLAARWRVPQPWGRGRPGGRSRPDRDPSCPHAQEEPAVLLVHVLEEHLVGGAGQHGPSQPAAHGALEAPADLAHPERG